MSTHKLLDTVCGFPEELLISQTGMVCRLLLKSSGPLSHKQQSTKKWMNSLTKLLKKSIQNRTNQKKSNKNDEEENFISFGDEANDKNDKDDDHKHKSNTNTTQNMDLNSIWSSLCLLSTSYRIISSGYHEWSKHCQIILDLTENPQLFYHPVLRTRCFETLCEIIEYSRFETDPNSYQLSLQIAAKFIRFLQNILFEIVLTKNESLNCGGRLLRNVLMMLYRLLSNGKNLNAKSNISLIHRACFHCLKCSDSDVRSIAIGIIIVLCNNDKKYNGLVDCTAYTLRYLLKDLFPSNNNYSDIDKGKCIEHIIEIIPSKIDIDSFERISLLNNVMNGLIHLLCHLLRRKNKKALFALNASSTSSVKSGGNNDNIKIVSGSCSMNSFVIHVPLKNIMEFIKDITSITISEYIKYGNLIEYTSLMSSLYQNALWLLVNTVFTLQQSILPYGGMIARILLSVAKETKQLKCNMEYEIRSSLYRSITHIVPILGGCMYDILFKELKIHLMDDLKCAQKLLMTSPPNAVSLNEKKKQKLIIKHKKRKLTPSISESNAVFTQRQYDTKLAFYGSVLRCIASFVDLCSNYMSLDEKSEIEVILCASVLRCYSDNGHILINLCLIDLLNDFIALMVSVLRAPKMYKKQYLSLTAKLLSSSFEVGTNLGNKELIQNSINGLRYIESVIHPRSKPVYNQPLKAMSNDDCCDLRNINKWNHKMRMEIDNDKALDNDDEDDEMNECDGRTSMVQKMLNGKRTFAQFQTDDDDNNDVLLNETETNNFMDDDEDDDDVDEDEDNNVTTVSTNNQFEANNDDNDENEVGDDDNNFNQEIESMIKDYGNQNDDNGIEPLWHY